jgi:hypothetical protein
MLASSAVLISACLLSTASAKTAIEVTRWNAPGISSDQFESHATFDPHGTDIYFVRSSPKFEGWRILVSHCGASGWSAPESPAFAGDGVEADPWFTPDGRSLYFISTRSTDGIHRKDLDIWRVDRAADGHWGTPARLPEPVNSTGSEWFPRLAPDGWLYFGSSRPGGLGKNDIWRARKDAKGVWTAENVGPHINTAADEYEPLVAPDGASMIFMADGGFYASKRVGNAWAARVKLPPEINVNGSEIGATLSPSGHTLLFTRDLGSPESGEFFVAHLGAREAWPRACPLAGSAPGPAPAPHS